ncbi:MAG: hypothetical protein ACI4SG_02885 [Oligosphaeraceae bacterium]
MKPFPVLPRLCLCLALGGTLLLAQERPEAPLPLSLLTTGDVALSPLRSGEARTRREEGYRLEGSRLLDTVSLFGGDALPAAGDVLALRAAEGASGFYNMNQDWDTSRIRQLEFTLRADKPGFLQFSGNLLKDGKKSPYQAAIQSLIPDGEWHTLVIPTEDTAWQGTLTNWELRWMGATDARLELQAVDALPFRNAFPNAALRQPGAPLAAPVLRPRAQCLLSWRGEEPNPGVRLHFLDHRLQEIPGTVQELPPGRREPLAFTTPEEMILTYGELLGEADGVPVLEQTAYWTRFESHGKWRGSWLWFQKEEGPNYYNMWLERTFDLPEDPEYAVMTYLADDVAFLYINGQYCGKNETWQVPQRANLTHVLKKGRNVMKIRVYNGEQAAGFVADVYVRAGGKDYTFDTDESWRCESKLNQPHTIPDVVEEPVVVLGNPHVTAPWKNGAGYRYAGPRGMLALEGDPAPGVFQAKVLALPPEPRSLLRITFTSTGEEKPPREYLLPLAPDSSRWKVGETLAFSYPVPPMEEGTYRITVDDDFLGIQDERPLGVLASPPRPATSFLKAAFQQVGTRPVIRLGDKTFNPCFWHSVSMVRGRRFQEMPLAPQAGIRNYRLILDLMECWKGPETFDYTKLEEAVDAMLGACPEAVFSLHINTQMPSWWLDQNPDQVCTFADGSRTGADRYMQSLASRKWREDASWAIRQVIRHLETRPYANRLWGISIAENHNGEWFWASEDSNRKRSWGGYNRCDQEYFQEYLQRKYGNDQALREAWRDPEATLDALPALPHWQDALHASLGTLRDPAAEQPLMDWLESRNDALAEAICAFAQAIKEESRGNLLAGFYYGYLTELGCNNTLPLALVGHNGLQKVLQSPHVDFLGAPSRYLQRKIGDADGLMHPWSSLSLHGVVTYNEMDYRTAYCRLPEANPMRLYVAQASSAYESVGQLNRGFAMNLACGIGGYWYDLTAGELYEPALLKLLQEQTRVWEKLPPVQGATPCQVAIVGNSESHYYTTPPDGQGIFAHAIEGLFGIMNQLAIPFDSLLLEDLLDPALSTPPRKLYLILPTLVLTREQREGLLARFAREKATVVWLYAAGAAYPGAAPSPESNGDFLGLRTVLLQEETRPAATTTPPFGILRCENRGASSVWFPPVEGFSQVVAQDDRGTPWVVGKEIQGATHYYSALMNLPRDFYQLLLRKTGVWQYADNQDDDQFWIGNDLLFLYTRTGGDKTLQLPPDMTAEAILGPFSGTLTPENNSFPALPAQTYGFLLKPLP